MCSVFPVPLVLTGKPIAEAGCQLRYLMCTINSQRFRLLPQKSKDYDILLIFYSLSILNFVGSGVSYLG